MIGRLGLALALMTLASPALAHGLLMKLQARGSAITGELYYSNGQRAGGEWLELFEEAAPATALNTIKSNPDGTFRFEGKPGGQYRVRASGDEGHEIVSSITLDANARGRTVDVSPAEEDVPAWAWLGGFLLLSTVPALFLRRRSRGK